MFKVGIVGYGYMGEIRRRVVEQQDNMILSVICDSKFEKSEIIQGLKTVSDPSEVIESDVDIVFICTPNYLIPDLTIRALKKGKHVFCEKPPGRSLADIEKMIAAEEASGGCKLMFGFNHRFHPGIQRAKKLVESGKFGSILWARGIYGKSGGKSFPQSWRNKKEISGGGILLDQGIHMLDLFNYFCGEFDKVKAFSSHNYWNMEVEDNAFVILNNSKNQNAILHSSATLWKHKFYLELGMENGYLIVEGLLSKTGSYGRETLKIGRRQFEDEAEAVGNPSEEIIYFDKDLSWEIEMKKFFDSITLNKKVEECSSKDAWKAMKIIDQAYRDCGEL